MKITMREKVKEIYNKLKNNEFPLKRLMEMEEKIGEDYVAKRSANLHSFPSVHKTKVIRGGREDYSTHKDCFITVFNEYLLADNILVEYSYKHCLDCNSFVDKKISVMDNQENAVFFINK